MRAVINESHSCLPECRTSERRREADRRSTRTASNRRGGTSWDRERSQGLGRRKRGAMHRAPPESSIESISFDGVKRTGSMCRVEMENPAGGKLAWTKTYPIGLDVHKKNITFVSRPTPFGPCDTARSEPLVPSTPSGPRQSSGLGTGPGRAFSNPTMSLKSGWSEKGGQVVRGNPFCDDGGVSGGEGG